MFDLLAQTGSGGAVTPPSSWSIWGAFYNWITSNFTLVLAWIGDAFCYCLGMLLSWVTPPFLWLKDHIPWPDLSSPAASGMSWASDALGTVKPYFVTANVWLPLDDLYTLSLALIAIWLFFGTIKLMRRLLPF